MKPSPARAEPHDATAWLPLPEVAALPPVDDLLSADPTATPATPRDLLGQPSPARSEPHDATTWLPLPEVDELPPIDDLLVPDPDVLPGTAREVPVGLPSPARAEPHDATAWLPIPDLVDESDDDVAEPAPKQTRHHRRPRLRLHLPLRSLALALALTLVVGGGYYGIQRFIDQPDVDLRVDGKLISVETGATTVGAFLAEQGISLDEHDEVLPGHDAQIRNKMRVEVLRAFPVSVNVEGDATTVYTTSHEPAAFVDDVAEDLDLPPDTLGIRNPPDRIDEDSVIQVRTIKTGKLLVDGQTVDFEAPVYLISELLEDYEIELEAGDFTQPYGVDDAVVDGAVIAVTRGASMTIKERELYTLPPERRPDPNQDVMVESRIVEGKAGVLIVTYVLEINNGVLVNKRAVSKIPEVEAVPTIDYYGTKYDPRWDKMAECETGGNWDATGFRYQGGLGIYYKNWSHYGGRKYAPTGGQATKLEQIIVAERIKAEHGWSAWGCNKRLGFSG